MYRNILPLALTLLSLTAYAQYGTERIEMKQYWNGYRFTVDEKKISNSQALNMMLPIDSAAHARMKRSISNNTFATIMGGAGGLLIGYPIGTLVVGGQPNWTLAIVGAALAGASIPISNKAKRQATEALDMYNSKVTYGPTRRRATLYFVSRGNGIGIMMNF